MKDSPLARMGELYGKLFYHFAKEMLSLGEEGEEALRKAIRNYAKDRGETERSQAESLGLPLNYETFRISVKDMPYMQMSEEYRRYHPEIEGNSPFDGFCMFADIWSRYPDGWDVARIYCDEFHHAKWAAFNPKFKIDMVEVITKGDPVCTAPCYIEGDEYDQKRQKDIEEICAKAKSYGFLVDSSSYGDIKEIGKNVKPLKMDEMRAQSEKYPTL
jgi:hypothetical protein